MDLTLEPKLASSPPRLLFQGPFADIPGMSWDASPDRNCFLVAGLSDPDGAGEGFELGFGSHGERDPGYPPSFGPDTMNPVS